jgi:hypothetical protein
MVKPTTSENEWLDALRFVPRWCPDIKERLWCRHIAMMGLGGRRYYCESLPQKCADNSRGRHGWRSSLSRNIGVGAGPPIGAGKSLLPKEREASALLMPSISAMLAF